MKSLLAIEWMKVKNYRTFWILAGFFALLLPLWNYTIMSSMVQLGSDQINLLSTAYSFSYVWDNVGYWASYFIVFMTILMIIITANEYSYRTSRQNVIDGWSRLQFYHAKWAMVLMLSVAVTAFMFLVGLLFGFATDDASSFPGHIIKLFHFWILSVNYISFGLLLALLFKRSGITIGLFFLYFMIIETMIRGAINYYGKTQIGNFLPLQSSDELLPFQLMEMAKTMMGAQESYPDWQYVLASFVWIVIYYLIGRRQITTSDW